METKETKKTMSFSEAYEALEKKQCVTRPEMQGKCLALILGGKVIKDDTTKKYKVVYEENIFIVDDGRLKKWSPSIDDIKSKLWVVV